jgi:hypothetical protein
MYFRKCPRPQPATQDVVYQERIASGADLFVFSSYVRISDGFDRGVSFTSPKFLKYL